MVWSEWFVYWQNKISLRIECTEKTGSIIYQKYIQNYKEIKKKFHCLYTGNIEWKFGFLNWSDNRRQFVFHVTYYQHEMSSRWKVFICHDKHSDRTVPKWPRAIVAPQGHDWTAEGRVMVTYFCVSWERRKCLSSGFIYTGFISEVNQYSVAVLR